MSEGNDQDTGKSRLSLRPAGRGEVGRTVDGGSVRQSFSHGRSKVVQVEVRKTRAPRPNIGPGTPTPPTTSANPAPTASSPVATQHRPAVSAPRPGSGRQLTQTELAARQRALADQQREAAKREAERREQEKISILSAAEEARRREEEARRAAEDEARRAAEEAASASRKPPRAKPPTPPPRSPRPPRWCARRGNPSPPRRRPCRARHAHRNPALAPHTAGRGRGRIAADPPPGLRPAAAQAAGGRSQKGTDGGRRAGRIDVQAAIEGEDERTRSLASVRRQRERERRQAELELLRSDQVKVVRDVVLPDVITVQELANRMAARAPDVIKALMKLGVMATITQTLDADTAELVVQEFGHRIRRVSESDVESGLEGVTDHRCRTGHARPGGHHHGPCRPRQNEPAGRAARHRCRGRRGRRDHPAYRRLSGGAAFGRADHLPGYAGPRGVHRDARARRQRHRHRGSRGRR